MKIQTGDVIKGYDVYTVCEKKYYGVALARKVEDEKVSFAVFEYYASEDKDNGSGFWEYFNDEREAQMRFFERMPISLDKYDVADRVTYELLKEEAENNIALYVFHTIDVTYEEVLHLQHMFDVDEVIRLYRIHKDWTTAIDYYIGMHGIKE